MPENGSEPLVEFLNTHVGVTLLTGAGCSTGSGIPDYRDDDGRWKNAQPVQYKEFLSNEHTRRRYWARSYAGWPRMSNAEPNIAHRALAGLQDSGHIDSVITQNVDNLHQRAGSRDVIDLHGNLRHVCCLSCSRRFPRAGIQNALEALNPGWHAVISGYAPDGDAGLDAATAEDFRVAACQDCGGMLKPDVVFFGEPVPAPRVQEAKRRLKESAALLIVGSSLMVWSGFRFARIASEAGQPVFIVNRGTTRADDIATARATGDCGVILERALRKLNGHSNARHAE